MRQLLVITSIIFIISLMLSIVFFLGVDIEKTVDTVVFNQTYSFKDVSEIDLNVVSTLIVVEKTSGDDVILHHTGSCSYGQLGRHDDLLESSIFDVDFVGGKVSGKFKNQKVYPFTYFTNCNDKLLVKIPEGFTGSLELESVSSDIQIPDFNASEIDLETVSGNIISLASSEKTTVGTVSGDISIYGGNKVSAESVSGDISVYRIEKGSISTVSGDVIISSTNNQSIVFESVSGVIEGDVMLSPNANINVDTVSGDVAVR